MGCRLCQNSEFYEFAMKCWYLQKLTGIYELLYWYLHSMLVFTLGGGITLNTGIYAREWYLRSMLVFNFHTSIYAQC